MPCSHNAPHQQHHGHPYFGAAWGGYNQAPQGVFGFHMGGYQPPPQGYFGRAAPPHPGAMAPAGGNPCAPQQACNLHNRWPGMPQPTPQALQDAAACVICNAQVEADKLKTAFGIDSGGAALIPAAGTATVTVSPQVVCVPERLVMTDAMANTFGINGIFSGIQPILATTGLMSAAMFVQDSTMVAFKSVTVTPGMDFTVQVTNVGLGAAARFLSGVAAKPMNVTL